MMIPAMKSIFMLSLNSTSKGLTLRASEFTAPSTIVLCDGFGLPHCSRHELNAWILFGIGVFLLITNTRNFGVFVWLLRQHWVNTDFMCLAIAGLNILFAIGVVVKTILRDLPHLWLFNQFEVNFIGAIQKYYLIAYSQLLAFMAAEILVAVRWPLVHRVHYSPKRTIRMVALCLLIDVPLACLHFIYGYSSTLEYIPEVLSVSASYSTISGAVYSYALLFYTGVPCVLVLVCSICTIQTLRRAFRKHNDLSSMHSNLSGLSGMELRPLSAGHRMISASADLSSSAEKSKGTAIGHYRGSTNTLHLPNSIRENHSGSMNALNVPKSSMGHFRRSINTLNLPDSSRKHYRGSINTMNLPDSSRETSINSIKGVAVSLSLTNIAIPATFRKRASENVKRGRTGQQHFSRNNLLTLFFMARFAVLYLGVILFTTVVCWVMDVIEAQDTLSHDFTAAPTPGNSTDTHGFDFNRTSIATASALAAISARGLGESVVSGAAENDASGHNSFYSLAGLNHPEPDPDEHVRTLSIVRGRIVFYSVYLIGIEDSLLYFWCNARFRGAHVRFWNALLKVFQCSRKMTNDGRASHS